jgi:hypothetical protein
MWGKKNHITIFQYFNTSIVGTRDFLRKKKTFFGGGGGGVYLLVCGIVPYNEATHEVVRVHDYREGTEERNVQSHCPSTFS